MLVVVTGQPHSGKTTILLDAARKHPRRWGFAAEEMREEDERHRSGFLLRCSDGTQASLASAKNPTGPKVSRYRVDLPALEDFLSSIRDPRPGEMAYIDEVGQMELYSPLFAPLVQRWIERADDIIVVVSTVHSHPLIDATKRAADVLIEVSENDREECKKQLEEIVLRMPSTSLPK